MTEEDLEQEPLDEEPAAPPAEVGREDLQMLLLSTPERTADIITSPDEARLGYRHGPAFPTAGEVAVHMATAGVALDVFLTAVCLDTGEPPPLASVLHPPPAAETVSLPELLADWQRIRRRGVDLLRGLAAERWETDIEDPERGRLTFIEACRLVLNHELGHLAQLRNLTALVPEAEVVVRTGNGLDPA